MENENIFENRVDLSQLNKSINDIKQELSKVIVGQDSFIEYILTAILANGHVLIEGVPGVAKTLTARLISKVIDSNFSRIQFTPDLMPSDITGTTIFNNKTSEFEFREGPVFADIVLIDEINRSPAKTQAALFEVMEERKITIDGKTYIPGKPFIVLATQNPIEHEGTYRLPEAQLDRFLFKINVGYPNAEDEEKILLNHHKAQNNKLIDTVSSIINKSEIIKYQKTITQVHIEDKLFKYIVEIVQNTRKNSSIFLGASPRASVNIMNAAKATAAINGRDFVSPEDIKNVIYPVLNHRIILTSEKEMDGTEVKDVINNIISTVEIPR